MNPEERYLQDPTFHALVDTMGRDLFDAHYTPTEMRQAAVLACIHYEQSQPHLNLQREVVLDRTTLREAFADLAHQQWSGWMWYLFSEKRGKRNRDGSWTIPEEFVARWQRQMHTPLERLSPEEQDGERKEADKFLRVLMASSSLSEKPKDGRIKLSDVLKVWDVLHEMDTGSMGFCDFEKAIDRVVGIENDITCPAIPEADTCDAAAVKRFGPIGFGITNDDQTP